MQLDSTIDRSHDKECRVLVVDDNPADVRLFRESLEPVYTVFAMSDAEQALALLSPQSLTLKPFRTDMIFLDISLPKMSGLELLAKLRADPRLKDTPIIVMTGVARLDWVEAAYQAGANSFFIKPILLDEYVSAIRACCAFWARRTCSNLETGPPFKDSRWFPGVEPVSRAMASL
jgi:CheY-like chemotaxis protein